VTADKTDLDIKRRSLPNAPYRFAESIDTLDETATPTFLQIDPKNKFCRERDCDDSLDMERIWPGFYASEKLRSFADTARKA